MTLKTIWKRLCGVTDGKPDWDDVYEVAADTDLYCGIACLSGAQLLFMDASSDKVTLGLLQNAGISLALLAIVSALVIVLRRVLPEWSQRYAWAMLGIYWLLRALCLQTSWTFWANLVICIQCFRSASSDYRKVPSFTITDLRGLIAEVKSDIK